ncbi:MAG: hypothetical protein ACPGEG_05660 [Salibacteraceae bacterium]
MMKIRIALVGIIILGLSFASFSQEEPLTFGVVSFKNAELPDTINSLLVSELSSMVINAKGSVNKNSPFMVVGVLEVTNREVGLGTVPETSVDCSLKLAVYNALSGQFSESEIITLNGKGKDELAALIEVIGEVKKQERSIASLIAENERSIFESFMNGCSGIIENSEKLRELGNPILALNYFNSIPRDGWECKEVLHGQGGQYYEDFLGEAITTLKELLYEALEKKDKKATQDIYTAMTYLPHCDEPMAELAARVTQLGINAESIISKVSENQIYFEQVPLEKWGEKMDILNSKVVVYLDTPPSVEEFFNMQIQDWLLEKK